MSIKKILFIRLYSLGDIVLTESCIRHAKQKNPESEIHYLTNPEYAQMVKEYFRADKVYRWDWKIDSIKDLKNEKYDIIIDLQKNFTTFWIKLFCLSSKNISYDKQLFRRFLIIKKFSLQQIDSIVWSYLKTVDSNINKQKDIAPFYPVLSPKSEAISFIKDKFIAFNIPTDKYLIGIFPEASHINKQYPIEKYANFISEVPDYWKCSFLIFGSWKDKSLFLKLKNFVNTKIYDLVGAFKAEELVVAMSILDIIISNDSDALHIAAALQKPQIVIYGATHTRLGYRPLNDNAVILQKNLNCQPCSIKGKNSCKKNTLACFRNIHSLELFDTFQTIFEDNLVLKSHSPSANKKV